jgi:hypothetical protein
VSDCGPDVGNGGAGEADLGVGGAVGIGVFVGSAIGHYAGENMSSKIVLSPL